jgi:hypothetical protein
MKDADDTAVAVALQVNVWMLLAHGRHHQRVVLARRGQPSEPRDCLWMNGNLVAPRHPDARRIDPFHDGRRKQDRVEHSGGRRLFHAVDARVVSTTCNMIAHLSGKRGIDDEYHAIGRIPVQRHQPIEHRLAGNRDQHLRNVRTEARSQSCGGNDEQS